MAIEVHIARPFQTVQQRTNNQIEKDEGFRPASVLALSLAIFHQADEFRGSYQAEHNLNVLHKKTILHIMVGSCEDPIG